MVFSAHMHAQEYRQRSDTTRTLLIIDGETGNPIEGAGVLAGGQVLVSLSEGTVTIPSRIPQIQSLYRVWGINLNIYP